MLTQAPDGAMSPLAVRLWTLLGYAHQDRHVRFQAPRATQRLALPRHPHIWEQALGSSDPGTPRVLTARALLSFSLSKTRTWSLGRFCTRASRKSKEMTHDRLSARSRERLSPGQHLPRCSSSRFSVLIAGGNQVVTVRHAHRHSPSPCRSVS